ncbi:hypothetical protein Atai01_77060 [Amycolatopsis taiwanensis]|uniref:Uncharacterized protein n=1 Tax=Amycolatopsis taiwanensis TaxID=342230 RepID=A0A9W6RBK2_9PSEU|nr:hypothetical protein Atai01_77060 [Amycolatopsis taiwanensis]
MPESGWQQADLEDLVGKFLTERLEKVTANFLALASDDASMGRLLRKSIRYWLVDQARQTAVGAVRRAVEKVLADEQDFERVPSGEPGTGRWRLAGTAVGPWSGVIDDLVVAARVVPNVKIPKWSSTTRRPPMANRASIAAVIRAVLTAAEGSLEIAQLIEVFVARFPVVLDPATVPRLDATEFDAPDRAALTPEEQVIAVEEEINAAASAVSVVAMLSPQEREIVRHFGDIPAIQALLNCGRTQAYHQVKRLREKLAQLVGDSDDVRAVGLEVIRLCGGPASEE